MTQFYEIYLILNPLLDSTQVETETAVMRTWLTDEVGATNLEIKNEGVKRLAYPIKKGWNGLYVSITFELELDKTSNVKIAEKRLNLNSQVYRYIVLNQTQYLKSKAKEQIKETEISEHREFNKGKKTKASFPDYLGYKSFDYKDIEFLSQFTSPYAKIFSRNRTGNSAKAQRKITLAIKQARHMALMPFTTKHFN